MHESRPSMEHAMVEREISDNNLIEVITNTESSKQDKDSAWQALQERYSHKVRSVVNKYLSNKEDVDEVINSVFEKAYFNVHQFNSDSFSAWIGAIARNTSLKKLRRNNTLRRVPQAQDLEDNHSLRENQHTRSPEDLAILSQSKEELLLAIDNLRDLDREIITLVYLQGLKNKEAAEILEIEPSVLKVRLHRAKKKLYRNIKENRANKKAG